MTLQKRGKTDNFYNKLQEKTLERLEQLCGKLWTDYNIHDPGITIADYLNYGLFELHYRLQSPFDSYLIEPGEKVVAYAQKGLLPKEELFEGSIVTASDYEQLILQRHPEIKKCVVLLNKETRLYDVFINTVDGLDTADKERLLINVRLTYHSHRNLCESIGEIKENFESTDYIQKYNRQRLFHNDAYEFPSFSGIYEISDESVRRFSNEYHSIQFDFPETYGIGERGLPAGSYYANHAHILQLKGYLLLFDHLLADTLKQAASVNKLLEFSADLPDTSIPQITIPEGDRIIDSGIRDSNSLRDTNYYESQKALYLNVLDVLYGEDTHEIFKVGEAVTQHGVNEKRANIIRRLPVLNADRFLSFNIYDAASKPGIQEMMEALTDYHAEDTGVDTFGKYGLRIISDQEFYEKYRFLQNTSFTVNIEENAHLEDVEETGVVYEDRVFHKLRMNINLLWYNVLFQSFLRYGDDKRHYKILTLPDNEYLLVFKHPESNNWINMGLFFATREKLVETANLFWQFIKNIKHQDVHGSFYFIEHLLLAHGHEDDRNKLSVIVPEYVAKSRHELEHILSERLPAHIKVIVIYVSLTHMYRFETIYNKWRKALATGQREEINYASIAVRAFLSSHVHDSKSL